MANIFNELIDMTTNNEIIDMYFPPDEQGFNIENVRKALNFLMDKARADTTTQIVDKLNKVIAEFIIEDNDMVIYMNMWNEDDISTKKEIRG